MREDGVRCPDGFFYSPHSSVPCLRVKPTPNLHDFRICPRGSFAESGTCKLCQKNMTTIYAGSISEDHCSYCDPGSFLYLTNDGSEACFPCDEATCHTTEGAAGSSAHRMTSCAAPCGPKHMHPDVSDMFRCNFDACFHKVRPMDIHECVFDSDGDIMHDARQERPCHNYFRPLTETSLEDMKVAEKCQWGLLTGAPCASFQQDNVQPYGDELDTYDLTLFDYNKPDEQRLQYLRKNNRLVAQRSRNFSAGNTGFGGIFYRFHITNSKQHLLKDELPWAQLINVNSAIQIFDGASKTVQTNTEHVVVDKILEPHSVLSVKDLQTLYDCREDMSDCSEPVAESEQVSGNFTELRGVDFVRGFHEIYSLAYLNNATQLCDQHRALHPACSVYFCNEKSVFTNSVDTLLFRRTRNNICTFAKSGWVYDESPGTCSQKQGDIMDEAEFALLLLNATQTAAESCNCLNDANVCDFECLLHEIDVEVETYERSVTFCMRYSTMTALIDQELQDKMTSICRAYIQIEPYAPLALWFCHPQIDWMQFSSFETKSGSLLGMAAGVIPTETPTNTCPPFISSDAVSLSEACYSDSSFFETVASAKNVEYHRGAFRQKLTESDAFFQQELNVSKNQQTLNCTILQEGIAGSEPCLAQKINATAFRILAIRKRHQPLDGTQTMRLCMHGKCASKIVRLRGNGTQLFPVTDTNSFYFVKKYIDTYVGMQRNKVR